MVCGQKHYSIGTKLRLTIIHAFVCKEKISLTFLFCVSFFERKQTIFCFWFKKNQFKPLKLKKLFLSDYFPFGKK